MQDWRGPPARRHRGGADDARLSGEDGDATPAKKRQPRACGEEIRKTTSTRPATQHRQRRHHSSATSHQRNNQRRPPADPRSSDTPPPATAPKGTSALPPNRPRRRTRLTNRPRTRCCPAHVRSGAACGRALAAGGSTQASAGPCPPRNRPAAALSGRRRSFDRSSPRLPPAWGRPPAGDEMAGAVRRRRKAGDAEPANGNPEKTPAGDAPPAAPGSPCEAHGPPAAPTPEKAGKPPCASLWRPAAPAKRHRPIAPPHGDPSRRGRTARTATACRMRRPGECLTG